MNGTGDMGGMGGDLLGLLPELLTLGAAVLGLLVGVFLPRDRQRIVAWICSLGLAGALAATWGAAGAPGTTVFASYVLDPLTHAARAVVALATLLVVILASGRARGHRRETELYVLLLLAALGTVALAGAGDLLVFVEIGRAHV